MKTKTVFSLLVMITAPSLMGLAQTSVTNGVPATPPEEVIVPATNAPAGDEVADVVSFDGVALPDAVRALALQAGLNIEFDPRLINQVGPDGRPIPPTMVTEKWKKVSALEALNALLDNNGWQIEHNPKNPIVRITAKDPKALDPLIPTVVSLNYAEPTNVAVLIKATLSDRSTVAFDVRTHQLIIRTTEKELAAAMNLIVKLDAPTRQVLIEAKLVETTKDITSAKGVDWTGTLANQHVSFGNGLTTGSVSTGNVQGPATGATGTGPGGRPLGGSAVSTVVSNSANFVSTIAGSPSSAGGFTLNTASGISPSTAFLNADGVSAVLSFLNTDADTKSIAFPRTVSLDGVKNQLMVVQNIPVFEQQQSSGAPGTANLATVQPNYEKRAGGVILNEVGVKLTVIPRIAGPSNVLLSLAPEISSVDAVKATDTLNGEVNTSPIFDRRMLTTEASVPSGFTLVLGGLDNDVISKTYTKVPLLGDIPGAGYLFRSDSRTHTRDTILIFVTPTIIRDTDFQQNDTHFLSTKNEGVPHHQDTAWDSGVPYDWTKPKIPVEPVYQP